MTTEHVDDGNDGAEAFWRVRFMGPRTRDVEKSIVSIVKGHVLYISSS